MLGGTSLAPTAVPGQFDDASPAPSVTTYDEFGRPKLTGARSSGGENGTGNGASSGKDREGRGGDHRDRCGMAPPLLKAFFFAVDGHGGGYCVVYIWLRAET